MSGLLQTFPSQMQAWIFPLCYILPLNSRKLLLHCQRLSSILSFCKMLFPPCYTFNQNGTWQLSEQYCISETTSSCLGFSGIFKQTEAFDFNTSNIPILLGKGDFLLGPLCVCFQQPVQKDNMIDYQSPFLLRSCSFLPGISVSFTFPRKIRKDWG